MKPSFETEDVLSLQKKIAYLKAKTSLTPIRLNRTCDRCNDVLLSYEFFPLANIFIDLYAYVVIICLCYNLDFAKTYIKS